MKTSLKPLTRDEIIKILRDNKNVLARYKVKKIGLFGSFVKGEQTIKSDIDFFVEFEEPSLDNFLGLIGFLERLLKRKVEIITSAGLESIRLKHIKEEIKKSIIYA